MFVRIVDYMLHSLDTCCLKLEKELAVFIYDRTYKIIQFAGMKLPITAIQVERHSVNTIINTYMYKYIYIYMCQLTYFKHSLNLNFFNDLNKKLQSILSNAFLISISKIAPSQFNNSV